MTIDTNTVVSISEANQNFSRVSHTVDNLGSAVIFKNNTPKYLVLDFPAADHAGISPDAAASADSGNTYVAASHEEVADVSRRLMEKYDAAFKELAK